MAHHPTNKPNLGAAHQSPQLQNPTTDLTGKRHPRKPSSTSAAAATVYSLTNHFSRLHTTSNSKPQPHKLVDTHLQVKALSKSANYSEQPPSTQKTGKQGKRVVFESDNKGMKEQAKAKAKAKEKEKDIIVGASGGKVSKVEGQNEAGAIKPMTRRTVERLSLGGGASIGIGRRRSFCDVQVELGNFLVTNCAKVVSVDMPPFMQIHAVGFARKTKDSLEKFTSKSLALSLKKEFDGVYGPAWHCIVGTSFGSFVTHSVGGFMYFAMDQKVYVLLFKTSVQRAD